MITSAQNIRVGQKIIVPNYRDDKDCKETATVHNATTRNVSVMGMLTILDFGPGTRPVEVSADRQITVLDD